MQKKVVILGSTGSIGENTLKVMDTLGDDVQLVGLITHSNGNRLAEQVEQYKPEFACLINPTGELPSTTGPTQWYGGRDAALDLCATRDYDVLVSALVGFAGFEPTMAAIQNGKDIALANKETLIVAGHLVTDAVKKADVALIPIDSEHSAILQCLVGEIPSSIEKIILTASGGPFRTREKSSFESITVADALKHPNWSMGRKITIDSASLMNKGLEVIEARWLFRVEPEQISVLVHPQSIIHSMVQFIDGSVKAQLGLPDMKIPIQYALTYPNRNGSDYARCDFAKIGTMTFFDPDFDKFPCLAIAFEAMRKGGSDPCVMNAANEVAVDRFLNEKIRFVDIPEVISETISLVPHQKYPDFYDIVALDTEARQVAETIAGKLKGVTV